jgi:RND family efflux transporter MFP subunit
MIRLPRRPAALLLATTLGVVGCDRAANDAPSTAAMSPTATPATGAPTGTLVGTSVGTPLVLRDTTIAATFDANGVADAVQQATVSTKLMGTVLAVRVHEGDVVRAGQALVEIDARDLTAKATQVAASIADAEALQREAATHASRFRALYADSAATRAQYDAAETGLARADAGLRAANAGASELEAMRSYATVRAPFAGVVTMRMADPGAFAAPGTPLITVQDVSSLRISVTAPADVAAHLKRGQSVDAQLDGTDVHAVVEGVVPAGAGNLYTVNAMVPNARGQYRAGSAALLRINVGTREGVLVPRSALVRDGDLVGVTVRRNGVDDRRWIRLGTTTATHAEVLSGVAAGDTVIVPVPAATKPER